MKKAILVALLCFALAFFAQAKTADDPGRVSVGARPLGMGKAYVGLANDVNTIFLNPAGLTQIPQWQATSLSGKFVNEVNYLNLGMAIPTIRGNFGIAYVSSGLGFSASTTTLEAGRITASNETVSYSDYDTIWLLSYARPLRGDSLSAGLTLKLFSKNLTGTNLSSGNASGYDLDLGFLFKPNKVFNAGMVFKNIIPASMGGKIIWGTGLEEALPATLKSGLSLKLLGIDGLRQIDSHRLVLNLDNDYPISQSNIPMTWHLGLEWKPLKFLYLRVGIDQDTAAKSGGGVSVDGNLTAGIGLVHGKFRFDYAYHQYKATPGVDNHYFALNYGLFQEEEIELERERLEKERIERERLEKIRREKERLERLERERLEKIRREKERIERERLRTIREKARIEREKKEVELKRIKEFEEALRREQLEQERQERAKLLAKQREAFFKGIGNAFGNLGNAVTGVGRGVGQGVANLGKGIGNVVGNTGKALGALGQNVGRGVGGAVNNVAKGLGRMFEAPAVLDKEIERGFDEGERKEQELPRVMTVKESFRVLRKIFTAEKPLEELGTLVPQIATGLLLLGIKIILFMFVLLVISLIFSEWEKRTRA